MSTPDIPSEYFSAHFIATRLGTSSPNVMLKNASTIVIKMTHTVLIAVIPADDSMPAAFMIASASGSAKKSAANALPSKPASVIATCIVERNLVG